MTPRCVCLQEGCTYAVGLDGSKLSWKAFDFASGMVVRRDKQSLDGVHVLHISAPDHKKDLVPPQLHPDKLQSDMNSRNISTRIKRMEWVEQARLDGTTAGETLVKMTDQMEPAPPNFLVIGSFGRKEKDSNYLGHVPNSLLKKSVTDVFVVKQAAETLPQQKGDAMIWVIGTDNSACARHALDTTLALMQPPTLAFSASTVCARVSRPISGSVLV